MTCYIMRKPRLMEDEGRPEFIKQCSSQQEATLWIERQAGQYFRPDDYYVVERLVL